jgi:hypothetical protein
MFLGAVKIVSMHLKNKGYEAIIEAMLKRCLGRGSSKKKISIPNLHSSP